MRRRLRGPHRQDASSSDVRQSGSQVHPDDIASEFRLASIRPAAHDPRLRRCPTVPPVRATQDVDLVAEISSKAEYYEIAAELKRLGF